jgi:beta-lactamase class A
MKSQRFKEIIDKALAGIGEGVLAVGYRNLKNDEVHYYNESYIFPAASIVKVCILLEYLRQKDEKILNPDKQVEVKEEDFVTGAGVLLEMHRGLVVTLQDLAHLMIVISDNTASNMLMDQVGMENVNVYMKSLGLVDTIIGRKFMIDPNAKFSKNFTSVRDMVLLYEKLYKKEILTAESCTEGIEILQRQQYREKIPLLLPGDLKVAHKTGEITGIRHDCAVVLYEHSPYVLCLLTEKLADVVAGDRVLAELSKAIYDEVVSER